MTAEEIAELKAGDGIAVRRGNLGGSFGGSFGDICIHIISKVTATQIVVSYPSYQYRFNKHGFLRGDRWGGTRIERRATPEETAKRIEINAEDAKRRAENARKDKVAKTVRQFLAIEFGLREDYIKVQPGEKWTISIEGLTEEEAVGLSREVRFEAAT